MYIRDTMLDQALQNYDEKSILSAQSYGKISRLKMLSKDQLMMMLDGYLLPPIIQ